MISVAMTTYNGEKYIMKQLQSIYAQSKSPDEVIIVDDCSTDNTVEIVSEFINNKNLVNWKLITLPRNSGFINSFKKSIFETSGDIIFLCDQDDIWLPNKISLMSRHMEREPHILALCSSFKKIDENDMEIITKQIPFSSNHNLVRKKIKPNSCENISAHRVVAYNISPGCTCAFRAIIKESFKVVDNGENDLVHDWKINFIAALNEGLYFLNTPTILYRLHQNNSLGLSRDLSIHSRVKSSNKSAAERELLKKILCSLIKNKIILDNNKYQTLINYIDSLKIVHIEREKALKDHSVRKLINILFKHNLLKNRVIETIIIDIISLLKNKKIKKFYGG